MLRALRAAGLVLTVSALFALPGFTQEEDDSSFGGDEGGGGDTVSTGAAESGSEPASNAPESYVVQPGDTLWDLSQRFLNNPWYWPKIWSYNPQLDNPNWIRPGTRIRFYPGQDEPVQVVDEPEEEPEEDTPFDEVPLFEGDAVKKPDVGELNASTGRREFYVTSDQIEDAGRLVNSPEEKFQLSQFDNIYVDTKNKPNAGDLMQVFVVARDLIHPVTGANLGKVVHTTGVLRVDRVSDEQSLGTLVASWDPVERGSLVGQLEQVDIDQIRPRANDKDLKGYIVETSRHPISNIGDGHFVFVDRGQDDGVQPGNTFVVVRTGDPATGDLRGMADMDVGRVLIVDVGEKGSTGIVLASGRELVPGDRIEMRAGE